MTIPLMLTANKLIRHGRGLAPALVRRAASLQLDWDTRQKSRFDATDTDGRSVAVFLPRGTVVRGGDVLVADDGSLLVVHAAPQPVLRVRACAEHGSPTDLVRAAYHLGNRHVAVEIQADHLKIEPDHVLAGMLRGQHLDVIADQAAFEPEAGAYAGDGGADGPAHADHGHNLGHGSHSRDHDHGHGGDHGHDHGHDHDHGHGSPSHDHGYEPGHHHSPEPSHDDGHDRGPAHDAGHGQGSAPAPVRGKPVPVAVKQAPHVHGPGCGHGRHGHDDES